jgi:hypothetical protein
MFIVSMRINAHDAYDWDLVNVVSLPLQTSCKAKASGPGRKHSFDGGR